MSRHTDPFYSAKLPFTGIKRDISDLQQMTDTFLNQRNLKAIPYTDPDTGEYVYKIKVEFDVPDDIERNTVRILIEIRGALDKAIHGAAVHLGSRSLKHTNFPFGDKTGGGESFKNQLASIKGPWRGIPDELHSYLLGLEPYPLGEAYTGGNNLLALLGELSNPAKHQNTLIISLQVDGVGVNSSSDPIAFARVQSIWNEAKDECEVFRLTPTSSKIEFHTPVQISFNAATALKYKSFVRVLHNMSSMAEGIVLDIEAKTAEALKSRP